MQYFVPQIIFILVFDRPGFFSGSEMFLKETFYYLDSPKFPSVFIFGYERFVLDADFRIERFKGY